MPSRSLFLCFANTTTNSAFKNILGHSHCLIDKMVETGHGGTCLPQALGGRGRRITISVRPDEAV